MLKQSLSQKLSQKLSPQQIQLMKLLQLHTVSLEQRIKEEMEVNPALEEGYESAEKEYEDEDYPEEGREKRDDIDISEYVGDDDAPYYKYSVNNHSADDDEKAVPLSMGKTFQEHVISQLGLLNLTDHELVVAEHLVGNLDEAGYLRRDLESMIDDLAFYQTISTTIEELEHLLSVIQTLDPSGVGARDLQECLLIQIRKKGRSTPSILLAELILDKYFDEFTKKHYDKILKKLEINEESLKSAIEEVLKLNPKPGNSMNETQAVAQTIIPDFILNSVDGELELTLNSRNAPELRISRSYAEMLKGYSDNKGKADKAQKDAVMFVKQKLDSAKWFIDAIKQRQHTLSTTMEAIVQYQKEYFLTGDETKLRPMILKDIAEKVNLDISTISRVANSKYIQTPFGTFLIKTFFSESMQTEDGEEVSTKEIKKILQDCVGSEDKRKPYTDEKLAAVLKEKGYSIARRTVAKYREQLGIPVGRLRKQL